MLTYDCNTPFQNTAPKSGTSKTAEVNVFMKKADTDSRVQELTAERDNYYYTIDQLNASITNNNLQLDSLKKDLQDAGGSQPKRPRT